MRHFQGLDWPRTFLLFFLNALLLPQVFTAADGVASVTELERISNQTLIWGPYRPGLYLGIRPRIPKSLLMGLLWASVEDYQSVQQNFRHTCEQSDNMAGYGWTAYDARTGGVQTIHDPGNRIDITTSFVKLPGGEHGGNWGVRVLGRPRADAPDDLKTTVIFYTALEGLGSLECVNEQDTRGVEGTVRLEGESGGLSNFAVEITEAESKNRHPVHAHPSGLEKSLDRTLVHSFQLPEEALWQTKPVLFAHMRNTIEGYLEKYGQENPPPPSQLYTLENEIGRGNLHMVQKVYEGTFEFDILFSSASAPKPMTSEDLSRQIPAVTSAFASRYTAVFESLAPFTKERYLEFSKSLFSNLLGGIGYFYGDSKVDRSYAPEYEEENEGFWEETAEARARNQPQVEGPSELFTSIPSRPFFPRGFLWDEGFHLLPVIDWDVDLTLDIVKSWFNRMDEDGWIAREQILGPEARSKVPPEFQVQYPHYANPPTLFFILDAFLDKVEAQSASSSKSSKQHVMSGEGSSLYLSHPAAARQYLRELYPLLKRHYFWFRRTQHGDVKSYDRTAFSTREAYRWRGRTPQHILTSGLDDYPRAQPPHPGELHVDLISWMGMMTKSLKRIALYLNEEDDAAEFSGYETAIVRNIDDLHWSQANKMYCDATIDDYEESVHVCHKGYISLFPFMTGLMDAKSEKLKHVLDLIGDEEELWSPHGIRSLSKRSEFYNTAENYWRSPVWVNINYLIVLRLLEFAQTPGPYQSRARKMYTDLRINLVDTVYKSWEETGFAWEQYNPETGAGQRTQHFTGWTSLVVKIMAMPDLSGERVRDEL